MKKVKRLLAMMLVFCMMVSVVPVDALAEEETSANAQESTTENEPTMQTVEDSENVTVPANVQTDVPAGGQGGAGNGGAGEEPGQQEKTAPATTSVDENNTGNDETETTSVDKFSYDGTEYEIAFAEGVDSENVVAYVIGEKATGYASLANAIAQGGTVVLVDNLTVSSTIEVTKNTEFDLNGYTVTGEVSNGRPFKVTTQEVVFKINGTTTESKIHNIAGYGIVDVYAIGAELYVNGGEYTGTSYNGSFFRIRGGNYVELNNIIASTDASFMYADATTLYTNEIFVNNGTFTQSGATGTNDWSTSCFEINYSNVIFNNITLISQSGAGIYSSTEYTTTDINNCSITILKENTTASSWQGTAIAVCNGASVNVNGGTYKANQYAAYIYNSGGTLNIQSGTFEAGKYALITQAKTGTTGTINVSGGDYTGNVTISDQGGTNSIVLKGGTFTVDPSAYVAEGYEAIQSGDTWTVQKSKTYVARIGETKYESLQDALNAVGDGETVVLVDNLIQNFGVNFDKSGVTATLDLNGKTLKVTDDTANNHRAIKITAGTLSIKNGVIDARNVDESGNPKTFTDEVNFTNGIYGAIRAEGGNVVLKDLTLFNNHLWGMCIKVCENSTGTIENCTVESVVGGCLEAAGGNVTVKNSTFRQTGSNNKFSYIASGLAVSYGGTVDIENSGFITSGDYALYVFSSGGTINAKSGTFSGTKDVVVVQQDHSSYPNGKSVVNIFDGVYTGAFNSTGGEYNEINISGGTFSANPTEYVTTGYRAIEVSDNEYKVVPDTTHVVETGSILLNADGNAVISKGVAAVSGGGLIDGTTTLKTTLLSQGAASNLKFIGWYAADTNNSLGYFGEQLSPSATWEVKITADVKYVAVYKAVENAETKLTVDNSDASTNGTYTIKVTGGEEKTIDNNDGTVVENTGVAEVEVTYTETGAKTVYWLNSSGHLVGTGETLKTTVVGDTKLTAVVVTKDTTNAKKHVLVRFVSDYAQYIDNQSFTIGEINTLKVVSVPNKLGYTPAGWTLNSVVYSADAGGFDKLAAAIKEETAKYADGSTIDIKPSYTKETTKYTVIVMTQCGDTNEENTNLGGEYEVGSKITVNAPKIEGYNFEGWYINDVKVGSSEGYFFAVNGETTLVAKYVQSVVSKTPVVAMTETKFIAGNSSEGIKDQFIFTSSFDVPEGYTKTQAGIEYRISMAEGATVLNYTSEITDNKGYIRLTFTARAGKYAYVYARGYVTYIDDTTGTATTIYSNGGVFTPLKGTSKSN